MGLLGLLGLLELFCSSCCRLQNMLTLSNAKMGAVGKKQALQRPCKKSCDICVFLCVIGF